MGVYLRPPTFGHPKYRERQMDFKMLVVSIPAPNPKLFCGGSRVCAEALGLGFEGLGFQVFGLKLQMHEPLISGFRVYRVVVKELK